MHQPLLLTLLLAPAIAFAQVRVPADVESVASGGYWTSANGVAGRYRVVVLNSGFEAVTSRVYVQWVRDPRPDADPEVVATVEPMLPFGAGVASLSAKLVPLGEGKVRVAVQGVLSREPRTKVSASFIATAPGKLAP